MEKKSFNFNYSTEDSQSQTHFKVRIMVDPAAIKKEWKEIFSTMDQDQSGSITCNELYKFIVKVMNIKEEMVIH